MAVVDGTNAGFVSSAPSANPGGSNRTADNTGNASRFDSPAGTNSVTSMGWYCDNATEAADFQLGIYSHDAGGNLPNVLLASSGDIAKGTDLGWKTGAVSWALDASTTYWLASQLDDTATTTSTNSADEASHRMSGGGVQTELPANWASSYTSARLYACYALYSASGAAGPRNQFIMVN